MTNREPEAKSTDSDPMPIGPLDGKTILVTRPLTQSSEITRRLEERGATVLHCPTIEIAPPSSWDALDSAIARLESYDWLVFTSANGAHFFFERVARTRSQAFQQPVSQLICAIGPATARAVGAGGRRVDLVTKDSRGEGVLREIVKQVGNEAAIRGLRFLLPSARQARDFLPVELRRLGAQVDTVEAYQTFKPHVDIESLFGHHKIDAITFTSPSTVSNFATLTGDPLFTVLCNDTLVACIGPVTAAAALEHGFKRVVQAESANSEALAAAVAISLGDE